MKSLNGNTLNMFVTFASWEEARKNHPHLSERQFVLQVLGITTSAFYRKRQKVMAKQDQYNIFKKEMYNG